VGLRHPAADIKILIEYEIYILADMNCVYGVALVSRIDRITGLFCKRDL